jgi:hypothetical protein
MMKLATHTETARALGITPAELLALCADGLPHSRARAGRAYDLQAVRRWMERRAPAKPKRFDHIGAAAELFGVSRAEARKRLEAINEREAQKRAATREHAPTAPEHDRLALAIAMGIATHEPATRELAGGAVLELGVRYALPASSRASRSASERPAPAPRPAPRPPHLPAAEKAALDAAMGLHETTLFARDEGNKLVLGAAPQPFPIARA